MAASATFTAKFTANGTYTFTGPTGVATASTECWGSGAGGDGGNASNFGSGGGAEYAAELSNTITAGNAYTVVVGAGGAAGTASGEGGSGNSSSFTGTGATTVTAHGGSPGSSTAAGGAGGTGSTNSVHHDGGAGGNGTVAGSQGGGGGGGSGGTSAAGNTGSNNSGSTGGAGATAVTGGGPGGTGGSGSGTNGTAGLAPVSGPGGGGGAGGFGSTGGSAGGAGFDGQAAITWSMSTPAVISASTSGGTYQWTAPVGITSVSWTISGTASFNGNTSSGTQAVTPGTAYTFSVGSSSSLTITWGATPPDIAQIQPGPTWLDFFKPGMPRPRPPAPPSGPYFGNQPNLTDQPQIDPGATWFDLYKPGMPRPRPFAAQPGILTVNGGVTAAAASLSGTIQTGIGSTGGVTAAAASLSGAESSNNPYNTPDIQPGPQFVRHFKPGLARPLPFQPETGPPAAAGKVTAAAASLSGFVIVPVPDLPLNPGPTWLRHFKPGLHRPQPFQPSAQFIGVTGHVTAAAASLSGTSFNPVVFPAHPLPILTELLLNGAWVDISRYVQQRADIVITRGRADEASQINPAQVTLTLDNRDGRFSPKNSGGAYFPYIGRNVQLRISIVNAGSASIQPYTGYRFWGEVSAWPPRWDQTGKDIYVPVTASGILRRYSNAPPVTAATRYVNLLTGVNAPVAYWPCDDSSGATQLASAVSGNSPLTITTSAGNTASSLSSDGSSFAGCGSLPVLNQSAWSGVVGSTSGTVSPQIFTIPGTYTFIPPNAVTSIDTVEVWGGGAAGGDSANTDGTAGTASSFTGDAVTTTANPGFGGACSSNGGFGGLGGSGSSAATHHSGGSGANGTSTNGGGGGSSGGSASAGNPGSGSRGGAAVTGGGPGADQGGIPPVGPGGGGGGAPRTTFTVDGGGGGAGEYAKNTGVAVTPGSPYTVVVGAPGASLPDSSGNGGDGGHGQSGQVKLTWSGGSTPNAAVIRFCMKMQAGSPSATLVGITGGGGTVNQMFFHYDTPNQVELSIQTASSVLADSGAVGSGDFDGIPLCVSIELTQSGTNVAWALRTCPPGSTSVTTLASGTFAGTVGGFSDIQINQGFASLGSTVFGAVVFQYALTSFTDYAVAMGGHSGELAGDRFERLCTESGVAFSLTGLSSDTPQMGPQQSANLPGLLQAIEDFDRGQLFETRDQFGLGYRTRVNMQGQSAAVTYDYTHKDLSPPLEPTVDDQLSRNDVTVQRMNGSSARETLASGSMSVQVPPSGIGEYAYSLTVNAFADTQLANCALWIMTVGTVDDYRYPEFTVDLSRTEVENLFTATADLDIGDFVEVVNPPSFLTPDAIKQLAWGFTETLNAYKWVIGINTVPESPYSEASPPTW